MDMHDGHGEKQDEPFPLAHVLVVVGFILMLAMDQVIFKKSDVINAKINESENAVQL